MDAEETRVRKFLRSELSFYIGIIVPTFIFAGGYFGLTSQITNNNVAVNAKMAQMASDIDGIKNNHLAHLQTYYEQIVETIKSHTEKEDSKFVKIMDSVAAMQLEVKRIGTIVDKKL